MIVKELIEKLSKLNEELPVFIADPDNPDNDRNIMDVIDVDIGFGIMHVDILPYGGWK